ncbi:MBL fold metallo-hydrolase [Notoacmeibacter sp. MSK16QG-6]|uniref:MBL fold metallo-hydrolase n=1 Tax=Notoacmeibacter sp. MSK16QG-6 TaxID=2957982 RepID=UPI00209CCAC8|nr:MBL fold metallo-hydrolase [Notoacmeibacter sp. MSK16QG-6]MCP1200807.1 MBL fold metallo-hydrolase [Notoacmeibacter sp. MSK16QG-6]
MTMMVPNRRDILTGMAALGSSMLLGGSSFALGRHGVGDGELLMLSDGNLTLPLSFVLPGRPEAEIATALMVEEAPEALTPDCNVTLLRRGDKLILFDVGSGPNFMPSAGELPNALEEAGIDPQDVTDVVFTHAHPDHFWGLTDDFGDLLFPDAAYHMSEAEWAYWSAEDTLEKTPEARKTFVVGAQNRMPLIEEQISLFQPGAEIVAGIEAMDTSGHTPGHISFVVHGGDRPVLIGGDALTHPIISFAHPEWESGSDTDPQKGIATRKMLLDRLVSDDIALIGFHLPHPGFGHAENAGDGAYVFVTDPAG